MSSSHRLLPLLAPKLVLLEHKILSWLGYASGDFEVIQRELNLYKTWRTEEIKNEEFFPLSADCRTFRMLILWSLARLRLENPLLYLLIPVLPVVFGIDLLFAISRFIFKFI